MKIRTIDKCGISRPYYLLSTALQYMGLMT